MPASSSSRRSTAVTGSGPRHQVRTFQKQKHSDDRRARSPASKACGPTSTDTTVKFDYLIQTTTNYAFLDDIAFRTGFEWWIDGQTLHFGPRKRVDRDRR